jgi:hypothetical protein
MIGLLVHLGSLRTHGFLFGSGLAHRAWVSHIARARSGFLGFSLSMARSHTNGLLFGGRARSCDRGCSRQLARSRGMGFSGLRTRSTCRGCSQFWARSGGWGCSSARARSGDMVYFCWLALERLPGDGFLVDLGSLKRHGFLTFAGFARRQWVSLVRWLAFFL